MGLGLRGKEREKVFVPVSMTTGDGANVMLGSELAVSWGLWGFFEYNKDDIKGSRIRMIWWTS